MVDFESPLIEVRLIRRYKRFLADVVLPDGATVTAHCANSGRMTGCFAEGARGWVRHCPSPTRKLAYSLELTEIDGALICVNPHRANAVVAEGVTAGVVPPLRGYPSLRREVKYAERSRVDLLLEAPDRPPCYVEVKSVTLSGPEGHMRFPDAVTERGRRHLEDLSAMVAQGARSVLLFSAAHGHARSVTPADDIDPAYGRALRRAAEAGVEILAHRVELSPQTLRLAEALPVRL
jgi:sugar fermentation stimulation protein A